MRRALLSPLPIAVATALLFAAYSDSRPAGGAATAASGERAEPGPLPATVTAGLESVAQDCRELGGEPMTARAIQRADLNGDGREDYVLDLGSIGCDGAPGIYGDREKMVTVYVGDAAGGATEAFRDPVFGAKLERSGPAAKLWLTLSGSGCGEESAADFASEKFCERALSWTDGKFEYAPVSTVRMIQ